MRRDIKLLVGLTVLVLAAPAAYLAWDLSNAGKVILKSPWTLLMLLGVVLAFWVQLFVARRRATLAYSSVGVLARLTRGPVALLAPLPPILRVGAIALLVVALARPQTRDRGSRIEVEGIDIMIALDLSNSMEASDLVPSRLEAAKKVIDSFIARRKSDRIGLVVFGREAFTQCPLTLDYSVLRTMLAELRINLIDGSGTAVGNALGVSLARLRKSDAKSRVVILLTDGDSNAGNVTPKQAARYASAMKVKVFTILMGPSGETVNAGRDILGRPIRVRRQYPVNPKLLETIAAQTGGKAYLATDRRALEQNFEKILSELDKSTRRDVAAVFTDAYRPFAALALLLLALEALLRLTRLREFP
ncbi:MAG: VWA domain-containing protein [Deltaproteobacteria bacterium]|nr:VWA domain-containing protein [Deltaproteobacteria bacterium]